MIEIKVKKPLEERVDLLTKALRELTEGTMMLCEQVEIMRKEIDELKERDL